VTNLHNSFAFTQSKSGPDPKLINHLTVQIQSKISKIRQSSGPVQSKSSAHLCRLVLIAQCKISVLVTQVTSSNLSNLAPLFTKFCLLQGTLSQMIRAFTFCSSIILLSDRVLFVLGDRMPNRDFLVN